MPPKKGKKEPDIFTSCDDGDLDGIKSYISKDKNIINTTNKGIYYKYIYIYIYIVLGIFIYR